MTHETSFIEKDYILLIQTKSRKLEQKLSKSVIREDLKLFSAKRFEDINDDQLNGEIVSFLIGSDIEDPVQSAQRLHVLKKNAKIILLAKTEKEAGILKESIRFSPFIGMDVFCIDESNESELKKVNKILEDSVKAEKYRTIIAKTNSQISSSLTSQKQEFNLQFTNRLMEIAPIGIAIVNKTGKILGWNKKAASIFNTSEAQVLGTELSRLFNKAEGNILQDYLKSTFSGINGIGQIKNLELERVTWGKSRQFLNFTAALFTTSETPEKVLILVINDITDRKLAETKLREVNYSLEKQAKKLASSNADLEQFAFVASHDLQEPLRMITGFLARLEKRYESILDEKGKRYIHFATDGARRMRQIILDLLEYSRVGKVDMDREKIDLNKLIEEVLALHSGLISRKNVEFKIDEMPVIIAARGPIRQLFQKGPIRQLFQNLINNAIKYQEMDNTPIVKISWSEDVNYWHFKVSDNGIGIKKEYSDKIFNIFQRLHSKSEYSGTGVGLAICKKIVDEHGGSIAVDSKEGKGSTFHFTISKKLESDKSAKQH